MASLRYHAGRMVLYEEEPSVWRVKIKTKKGKVKFTIKSKRIRTCSYRSRIFICRCKMFK